MNYNRQKKIYISIAWLFCIIVTVIYGLVLIVLYRNQTNIDTNTVSDIFGHIGFGISGSRSDSIMFPILAFLWNLSHYRSFLIALVLTIFSILSIFFTYILLKMHIKNVENVYVYAAALVCNIYMPIHIPFLYIYPIIGRSSPYIGMFGFNLWHNSTYIAMKPFALLSMILFFKLINNYYTKSVSIVELMCFCGSLFITSLFKLSFAFVFMPCMLIFMIIDFIKGKGKNILNYVLFGITILPTALLMIWHKFQLFDQTHEIGFGFLKAWMIFTSNPLMALVLSLSFPLVVLIFNYKDLLTCKVYQFSWIFVLIGISTFAFLYESGSRLVDGNFAWGAHFAVGLLFVISMYKFIDKIKHMSKFKLMIVSSVLGMHILCGINYILKYFCTGTYL